jgi:hypothetical protein
VPDPANYIVYRDNPTSGAYHAVTATGASIASNATDPYPVLQAALNRSFWNDPASGSGPEHRLTCSGPPGLTYTVLGTFCHHNFFLSNRPLAEQWAAGSIGSSVGQEVVDESPVN